MINVRIGVFCLAEDVIYVPCSIGCYGGGKGYHKEGS